ncbi:MAG: asparagine synthetase B family protein [Longimicrobiaceae bacterium]
MSGYLAILGGPRALHDRDAVAAAAAWLAPRSPDGLAGWSSGAATLVQGLLRLYPEDTAPPAVATLDGATWLVGDVRIDARDELRERLGPASRAASDAELVLLAFRAWGEGCLDHLIGDFSFLVWDEAHGEAFFATDAFAVRPLFHAALPGGGVAVSNTLGALRRVPGVAQELDELSIADSLVFGMSMEAESTVFSGIRRLQRAHCGRWSAGEGLHVQPYWTLSPQPELRLRDGREYAEAFRGLLSTAIRDRLRGSPVSIELSGGLDSPLLAALAKRELEAAGVAAGVRGWCFSHAGSFADPEPPFAQLAAGHLGVPLRLFDADRVPALDPAPETRAAPLAPLGPINHASAREMLGHARIDLTGFDGDALLRARLQRVWGGMLRQGAVGRMAGTLLALVPVAVHNRRVPRLGLQTAIRRRFRPRPHPPFPGWLREDFIARLGLRERAEALWAPPAAAGDDPRAEARGHLQTALWKDLFESYDPGATNLPHVVMHPLMDRRVVAFLHSLPPIPWCVEKHILRRAGEGLLPPEILRRRKTTLAGDPLQSRAAEVDAALRAPGALRGLESWIVAERVDQLDVAGGAGVSWEAARLASLARWLRAQQHSDRPPDTVPIPVIAWKGTHDVRTDAEEAIP